ncbi:MAG: cytochrome c3 family protein [Desulfuromonadales bacterium]|nr:cytochrome c3 family protein [Desulfuromonadales bacterium]
MLRRILVLIFAILLSATLWGCGSNRDSSGTQTTGGELGNDPVTGVAYVGAATCIGCHAGFSWSEKEIADYLAGKHVIHSDHITAESEPYCLECHDAIGDGPGLESLIDPADVPAEGLAAVGCENCHGAGGDHFGIGPIPVPSPDAATCGQCHDTIPDSHIPHHPEAQGIFTKYTASRHATASVRNEAVCSKCHTDEGGRLYKDVTTVEQLEGMVLPQPVGSSVQCRTCHNPHNAGGLLLEEIEDHGHVVASAEYATCITCHMSEQGNPETREGIIYHEDRHMRVIADTHYDNPETTDLIEGYVLDHHEAAGLRACLECHNVHAVEEIRADRGTTTINDQWASSAHGGHLLAVKKEVMQEYIDADEDRTVAQLVDMIAAGSQDSDPDEIGFAPAWVHYDWDAADRQGCQRCHTATGAKNFLNDPETYNPANNNFAHLEGWENVDGEITSSGQNEMLYCWGCHSNNAGALRNPGPITEEYDPAVVVSYPDVAGSNVCMSCHLGRETGAVIKTKTGFGNTGFVNSHYLTAGGQLFAETGYEYSGLNYNNVSYFVHDQIGTAAQPGTGENGPCVGCHMSAEQSHLFLPVEKDHDTGEILELTSTVCSNCHTPTPTQLNLWKEEYLSSLEILRLALEDKGIFFLPGYPYFFKDVNGDGIVPTPDYTFDHDDDPETDEIAEDNRSNGFRDWTIGGTMEGMDVMGAAFNFNLLEHDPGGYAHNRYYVKALIWDSIDYIFDGELDGDVPAAIAEFGPEMKIGSAAMALEYLDSSRPGDAYRPALQ